VVLLLGQTCFRQRPIPPRPKNSSRPLIAKASSPKGLIPVLELAKGGKEGKTHSSPRLVG
jgi:hypothetical protein